MKNRIERILTLPKSGTDFKTQLTSCFEQLEVCLVKEKHILQVAFFINANSNESYLELASVVKSELKSLFDSMPSVCIIAEPPAQDYSVTLEVIRIRDCSDDMNISYLVEQGFPYVVLESNQSKEIYAGGISAYKPFNPFVEQVEFSYALMESILHREGMEFSDIVRQWNYVEGILHIRDKGDEYMQNYQVLNDVRSRYYGKCDFVNGYPAATGIGMSYGGLVLEMYAVMPKEEVAIYPIKNPMQTDAYHYSEEVLVGDALEKNEQKTTPKFERAKYISLYERGTVYISGTASIQNEKTIGLDDTPKQTQITLENIASLVDEENLVNLGVSSRCSRLSYTFVRVYIKHKRDFEHIKKVCEKHYKNVPLHYLIADVCRDDLLVELEGVAESC